MSAAEPDLAIHVTPDEALILFDLLGRWVEDGDSTSILAASRTKDGYRELDLRHPGEFWALNNLYCVLETMLVEPFQADYLDLVEKARRRLVDRQGG